MKLPVEPVNNPIAADATLILYDQIRLYEVDQALSSVFDVEMAMPVNSHGKTTWILRKKNVQEEAKK